MPWYLWIPIGFILFTLNLILITLVMVVNATSRILTTVSSLPKDEGNES